ncbi:MAG: class I SAM-dependent methyltransferase [Ferruginibacter sp.]
MNLEYWREIDKNAEKPMFDFEEQYQRFANELPDGCRIAEVGVSNGKSALFLASKLAEQGKEFEMDMIDNLDYGKDFQMKVILQNIVNSGIPNINFIPKDSLNACAGYPDDLFDMVYLDSSHLYQETKSEIRCWVHKIKNGGILAGHDANYQEVLDAIQHTVPLEILNIEETKHNWGMWWFRKTENLIIK